jgi:hypothetical protein
MKQVTLLVAEENDKNIGQQLTAFEKETIIRWDETDDQHIEIYTSSKRVADRLFKAGVRPIKTEGQSWWFELPKYSIRIKTGKRAFNITGKTAWGS